MPKTLSSVSDNRFTVNGTAQNKKKNCECWNMIFIIYLIYLLNIIWVARKLKYWNILKNS